MRAVAELTADLVQAQVCDLTAQGQWTMPNRLAVDANVLAFVFYAGPAPGYMGTRHEKMAAVYAPFLQPFVLAKTLYTDPFNLAELAGVAERYELERRFLLVDTKLNFNVKRARYKFADELPQIRGKAQTVSASAGKNLTLLPRHQAGTTPEMNENVAEWLQCTADFGDAVLVAAAKRQGIRDICSDDGDLITCPGITVYTANRDAIGTARQAGKLLV